MIKIGLPPNKLDSQMVMTISGRSKLIPLIHSLLKW